MRTRLPWLRLLGALLLLAIPGCTLETDVPELSGACGGISDAKERMACLEKQTVRLTVIHTGDIHSRILPYDFDVLATDERLGLQQGNAPFGGIARAAHVVKRIRANAEHVIHVDSGDVFQGAPIFNEFEGAPEILALNQIGMDAYIIGNHEFDNGPINLYDKLRYATFPVLAANYQWRPTQGQAAEPLRDAARPYTIIDRDGLKVGVIGMANFSSLSSISYGDGGLGITVLENVQVVQSYIDILRPQVNVIVCVTHLGLGEDEELIRRTRGLDIVFGGHLHIVLNPPKNIPDLDGRFVPLVHSGAFLKYIGRFDGAFTATSPVNPYDRGMTCNGPDDCLSGRCDAGLCRCDSDADCAGATRCAPTLDEESFGRTEGEGKVCRAVEEHNYELESFDYEVIPIDNTLPEDAEMAMLMDPWERELSRLLDLRKVIGYTPQPLRRFGPSGGDSPLGNFLSDTMAYRSRVEADFSATNSLGIRTDINRGPITMDQMYNVFPFPNTISTMTLSGNEVQELFDYNTYRSTGRGCATQLQVGGIEYELDCDTATKEVERTLDEGRVYEFEFRDSSVKYAKNIKVIRGACRNVNECALPSISDCSDSSGAVCNLEEGADIGSCRCRELVQPQFYYKFSTNNYMATGGSGFTILRFNTTQKDSGVDLREAAVKAIEQSPKCIDRCAEKMGDLFDRERLSTCATMAYCLADMTAYESRMCRALEKFSARDYCAENAGAGFCLGSSTTSNFERCLQANYSDCEDYFFLDQIEACRLREEADKKRCAAESKSSPRVDCLNTHAPQCLDASTYDPISPFDECRAFARVKAEELCPVLPCPEANADGRQKAIRPRNEATDGGGGGGTPVSIMEALQDAGFDACY